MSPVSRPPLARILIIDQRLREKVRSTALTLARELEVDSRTIHRDIAFMRDRLHAPIDYDRKCKCFCYSRDNFHLPYHQASEGELLAILLGANLLKQYAGTPFEQDLTQAFHKLTSALPEKVTISLESLRQSLSVQVSARVQINPCVYQTVICALRQQRTLEMQYWSASSNRQSTRLVDPYHVTMLSDDCFLIGYCHSQRDVRMFSMHRIRSCSMSNDSFTIPGNFSLSTYLGKSFRSVRGETVMEVILHFSSELAPRIAERTWHSTQTAKPLPNGGLELRLEVTALVEVMRWVLSWGKDCNVIKPRELKQLVANEHRLASKRNNGTSNESLR